MKKLDIYVGLEYGFGGGVQKYVCVCVCVSRDDRGELTWPQESFRCRDRTKITFQKCKNSHNRYVFVLVLHFHLVNIPTQMHYD